MEFGVGKLISGRGQPPTPAPTKPVIASRANTAVGDGVPERQPERHARAPPNRGGSPGSSRLEAPSNDASDPRGEIWCSIKTGERP